MAKFQLQSTERKNQKVIMVHSGETFFNEEGVAEVELVNEEQLQDMYDAYPDLVNPNAAIQQQTEGNTLGKSGDEANDIGGSGKEVNDLDYEKTLDALSGVELKKLVEDSSYPKEEWEKLNKKELKAYLLGKLSSESTEEDK